MPLHRARRRTADFLSRAVGGEKVFVDGVPYPAEERQADPLSEKTETHWHAAPTEDREPDRLVIRTGKVCRGRRRSCSFRWRRSLELTGKSCSCLTGRNMSSHYFAYHQVPELSMHDVYLFDYRREDIRCCRLYKEKRTTPQLISLAEEVRRMNADSRDENFLGILKDCFRGHIVSSVYLTGDGFDGDWMKQSVAFLCQGRRAFVGEESVLQGGLLRRLVQ